MRLKLKLFFLSHWIFLILLTLYFVTRLYKLTILPLFTDESIYLYWAKVIVSTNSQFFISLTDGKPPILIWLMALFLKVLPADWYLVAGRLPSVLAGSVGLACFYGLALQLFNSKKVAVMAAILLLISPFQLLYDRMALFDGLLSAMLLATCFLAVKTAKNLSLKYTLLWGLAIGLALLSKPTALIVAVITPLLGLFGLEQVLGGKKLEKFILLSLVALALGVGLEYLQHFSSVYYLMVGKNAQFQQPLEELIRSPLALTSGNLQGFFQWLIPYYTSPVFVLGLLSFVILFFKRFRLGLILLSLWLLPIVALATVGRIIFPRYILFTTPYFLLPIAYAVVCLLEQRKPVVKIALGIIVVLTFLPQLSVAKLILTDPPKAPLPDTDYQQYISEHPSGYGLDRIFSFIDKEAQTKPVTVVTQGTFGLYPYAFTLHYWGSPNVTIMSRWPLSVIDEDIYVASRKGPTFIILKEHDTIPSNLPLTLVLKSEKPGGKYPILVTILSDPK